MKEKILTAVSTLMIFIPWTILPLRTCSWALESPAAEIIIYSYAAFMVFSGIFTLLSYTKEEKKARERSSAEHLPQFIKAAVRIDADIALLPVDQTVRQ